MRSGPDRPVRAAASAAVAPSSAARTASACADEHRAGRGERDPPAGARQQRHAGLPFQGGELLRHRRRGVVVRLGDGGDRAAVGEVAQEPQPADVEHQLSLRVGCRNVNWTCTDRSVGRWKHDAAGLFVPLITPFDADGAVALDALETLAHEVLDDGAAGLVALGTTGEPAALTGPSGGRDRRLAPGLRGARRRR